MKLTIQRRVILGNQRHRRGSSLEFIILVIDQQGFLIGKGRTKPNVGSGAGKGLMNSGRLTKAPRKNRSRSWQGPCGGSLYG